MRSLDAALAFAITMLTLAMVATTIVETLHRIVGLREKGLAILLGNFYERVLVPRGAGRPADAEERGAFIDMMTVNRGPVGAAPLTFLARSLRLDARSEDGKFLNRIWSGRRLGSLRPTTFMERLGSSPHGARMIMGLNDGSEAGVELLLKDVAQKFDAFGLEASEYFEARARLLSVLVGFALAAALNVNALSLFDTFMRQPDITSAVIANSQPIDDAGARGGQAAADADRAVRNLQGVGVPLGWNAASAAALDRSHPFALARLVLGLALGGLLIGLGAPFWYRAVQTLTGIRRAGRGTVDTTRDETVARPIPSGPHQTPGTPIEAFQAAFGARMASGDLRLPEEAVG